MIFDFSQIFTLHPIINFKVNRNKYYLSTLSSSITLFATDATVDELINASQKGTEGNYQLSIHHMKQMMIHGQKRQKSLSFLNK